MPAPQSSSVRIVNRDRDQKFFEVAELDAAGEPKRNAAGRIVHRRITLGSTDDDGVADAASPEITLDGPTWDRLSKQKAVRGMVDARSIAVYPAG